MTAPSTPVILSGSAVVVRYDLEDGEGRKIESGATASFIHGAGSMLPAFEAALIGSCAGDRQRIALQPADAYGEVHGPGPRRVPRREFARHLDLRAGLTFEADNSQGSRVRLFVTAVRGAWVWVDTNHPLAGRNLVFDVVVVSVDDPFPL